MLTLKDIAEKEGLNERSLRKSAYRHGNAEIAAEKMLERRENRAVREILSILGAGRKPIRRTNPDGSR